MWDIKYSGKYPIECLKEDSQLLYLRHQEKVREAMEALNQLIIFADKMDWIYNYFLDGLSNYFDVSRGFQNNEKDRYISIMLKVNCEKDEPK